MNKRIFLIVLDSFGVGELPDAAVFGDEGSNTLRTIMSSPKFQAHNLRNLGLFNIDGIDCGPGVSAPLAAYGKCAEASASKDSTTGHWELCSLISETPMPTFPDGFPADVLAEFERRVGRKTIVNKPYSGTAVIADYGEQSVRDGSLIVYTSADSVFQIAAHEEVVPLPELYQICETARDMMTGPLAVGRVIARPFVGTPGHYTRTTNRRDFSLTPSGRTLLDELKAAGKDVIGIGKINDLFNGAGLTESVHTDGNTHGLAVTLETAKRDFDGLCFVNLVDFDTLYGHRNDIDGYAAAVAEFDRWWDTFAAALRPDDLVILTADHGCDPGTPSTDHSREYIPMLWYGSGVRPVNLHTRPTYADIGKTIEDCFGLHSDLAGTSLKELILGGST